LQVVFFKEDLGSLLFSSCEAYHSTRSWQDGGTQTFTVQDGVCAARSAGKTLQAPADREVLIPQDEYTYKQTNMETKSPIS